MATSSPTPDRHHHHRQRQPPPSHMEIIHLVLVRADPANGSRAMTVDNEMATYGRGQRGVGEKRRGRDAGAGFSTAAGRHHCRWRWRLLGLTALPQGGGGRASPRCVIDAGTFRWEPHQSSGHFTLTKGKMYPSPK